MKKSTVEVADILATAKEIKKSQPGFTFSGEELQALMYEAAQLAVEAHLKKEDPEELLSLRDIMKIFSRSKSTIYSWRAKKWISPIYVGSACYYRRSDISKIINQNKK